jgi:hypothetical protein
MLFSPVDRMRKAEQAPDHADSITAVREPDIAA